MAILKQNKNYNTTFLGWYGQCGEPKCVDVKLETLNGIHKVYQFTEDGLGVRTYVAGLRPFLQGFEYLKCGNVYWIVLKKGESSINIPEFTCGYYSLNDESLGMISKNCDITDVGVKTYEEDKEDEEEKTVNSVPCTKDIRVCPDGSTVVRDGQNDCKFPPCYFKMDDFKNYYSLWKQKNPTYYKFNFAWRCYCTEETRKEVSITVRYGKVIRIQEVESKEMISLAYNEGLESIPNKSPIINKYLSIEGLFEWFENELNESPYAITMEYDNEYGFIKSAFVNRIQEIADEELGFHISNFEELSFNQMKCRSDIRRCKDGTILKRDPNNNCRFPECPDEDETPVNNDSIPKLKFRWLTRGRYATLQAANIPNPWSTRVGFLSWKTVYGSRIVNPKSIYSKNWKPVILSENYSEQHSNDWEFEGLKFKMDENNHVTISLSEDYGFLPNPVEIDSVSHLYILGRDTSRTFHKSWSYPIIVKMPSTTKEPKACPEDVKICPDGTVVVRNPNNNCEFFECENTTAFADSDTDTENYDVYTPFSIEEGEGDFLTPDPLSYEQEMNTPDSTFSDDKFPSENDTPVSNLICTADVFECPDGTFVGRDSNNDCRFYPCPGYIFDDDMDDIAPSVEDSRDDDTGFVDTDYINDDVDDIAPLAEDYVYDDMDDIAPSVENYDTDNTDDTGFADTDYVYDDMDDIAPSVEDSSADNTDDTGFADTDYVYDDMDDIAPSV